MFAGPKLKINWVSLHCRHYCTLLLFKSLYSDIFRGGGEFSAPPHLKAERLLLAPSALRPYWHYSPTKKIIERIN